MGVYGFSVGVGPSGDATIPKADRVRYVQGNLPLHRPVQKAQTNLKLREVLLNSLLAYLTVYGFSVGVGPSGDAMIPKADRYQYVQGNLPLHRPVQVAQTNLKIGWHRRVDMNPLNLR